MDDPGPNFILAQFIELSQNQAGGSLVLKILLLLVLILVNAYFAMAEIAVISLNDTKIEKMADEGNKKAKLVLKLTNNPTKFLSLSTNGVVRLLGFEPNADEEVVTEEEIRMMVDVGGEKGVIEYDQKEMINNIFDFDDMDAGGVMTHRTDVVAADVNDTTLEEFLALAIENGRSRVPLYDEDIDNIVGIVYVKDLLQYVGKEVKGTLKSIMREPYFVPETKACGELFKEMRLQRIQMAVVVDEYGGTAGIVTLEDIVEAVMGNIQDEYDEEEEEISKIDENTFTVEGTIDIEEIDELIGKDLPEGDYETLAGFIMDELQCIPKNGEMNEVVFENVKFTVLEVEDRRIEKIKVEITPVAEENGEDEDDDD